MQLAGAASVGGGGDTSLDYRKAIHKLKIGKPFICWKRQNGDTICKVPVAESEITSE